MNSPSPLRVDVLINGGGPVGALLATLLGRVGIRVAVIETAPPEILARPGSDARAIAIAYTARKVIAATGAWEGMKDEAGEILEIRVTDDGSPLFLHYDHQDIGDEPLGWIVPNPAIRRELLGALARVPDVTLLAPARLKRLERLPHRVEAELEDGRVIHAALAVAADGRGSVLRQQAGIKVTRRDYHESGIVCIMAHEKPHQGIAHERFLPAGPFAILPLAGNRSGIVWTESNHVAAAICAQDDEAFRAELAAKVGGFLGEIHVEGPRFHHPLTLQFAETMIDHRLALIGDAAHGMHPIAGQGMNMGIRDVAALAEVIADALRLGLDPGGPDVLERYQRWRRFDTMLMLGLTDGLDRLFSNDVELLKHARRLGLAGVHQLGHTKRFFMRHAMGLVGDLPRLMKGEAL
ncbi:2-octaprenyl-3-methyl-6-methoxy-1 4-benzoquinol hydroxylase [Paramagnetospirillum magnetotacticum MS-1]|uniref:2-octaprenyl-3-methyl-6-methoxy-1 4-benzoquinol hydroxylase n=1 Tax=Paramagnetospirillum magnetotacticum MS-1 TaxID=272627 RepID=A0A0C2YT00_PARME|nr:UbiH/UbiF/VisC/COQ6 family ubiquinone biosynthesis hydroxylase [Paramagnetospirillum magnetotacticum]KIL97855.1 2-octaprenyl-3-methyl-6-methoxy-1 4-benzoquinol hydroxylase [Paramagnetospirillum magnetotacticum MS-1]